MSKLDWEKQNRREIPKEYLEDMERHSKKRASQKKSRLKKKAKAIQRKDTPKDRRQSFEAGKHQERERIIKNIKERVSDLRACSKQDNCQELAILIESYIQEWTEGEQK